MQRKHIIKSLPLLTSVPGRKYSVRVRIDGDKAFTDGSIIQPPELSLDVDDALLDLVRSWDAPELAQERERLKALADNSFPGLAHELEVVLQRIQSRCGDTQDAIAFARELASIIKNYTQCMEKQGPAAPSLEALQSLRQLLRNGSSEQSRDIGERIRESLTQACERTGERLRVAVPTGKQTRPLSSQELLECRQTTTALRIRLQALLQSRRLVRNHSGFTGRLNLRKLHTLAMGNSKAFLRKGERTAVNTAAHILLDASGSMSGRAMDLAGQACFAVASALHGIHGISVGVSAFPGNRNIFTYAFDQGGRLIIVSENGGIIEQYQYNGHGQRIHAHYSPANGVAPFESVFYYDCMGRLVGEDKAIDCGAANGESRHIFRTSYFYCGETVLDRVLLPNDTEIGYEYGPMLPINPIRRIKNGNLSAEYCWLSQQYLKSFTDYEQKLQFKFEYRDNASGGSVLDHIHISPLDNTDRNSETLFPQGSGRITLFCGCDQIGTPRILSDVEGNVVKHLEYDSFGNIVHDSNPSLFIPIGFAGGLYDNDTGLVRFGWRDYNPLHGRFLAMDPARDMRGDGDLYKYCADDPVSYTDPTGLEWDESKHPRDNEGKFAEKGTSTLGRIGTKAAKHVRDAETAANIRAFSEALSTGSLWNDPEISNKQAQQAPVDERSTFEKVKATLVPFWFGNEEEKRAARERLDRSMRKSTREMAGGFVSVITSSPIPGAPTSLGEIVVRSVGAISGTDLNCPEMLKESAADFMKKQKGAQNK